MKRSRCSGCLCIAALAGFLLSGCSEGVAEPEADTDVSGIEAFYRITDADQNTEGEDLIYLSLEDQSSLLKFDQPGDYVLSGKLEGRIFVDSQDQIVHLIFDGVEIQSNEGPALYVASAGKVVVTLADGSENVLRDTPNYGDYKEMQACIFSASDLTFNGGGSLQVYGFRKDAIRSKDVIKILGGSLEVWSKRDGIRASDGAVIMPKELSVESEGNGIRTTKTKKEKKGFMDICGGNISVIAGENAFSSSSDLYIRQCSVACQGILSDISCGGDPFIEKGCFGNE